eukprot:SAG31_NODE_1325_length_8781_cov_5.940221_4_plen_77_part_00
MNTDIAVCLPAVYHSVELALIVCLHRNMIGRKEKIYISVAINVTAHNGSTTATMERVVVLVTLPLNHTIKSASAVV